MVKAAADEAPGQLKVVLATPYGEEGMGGIDRLNDAIVAGFAAAPELGVSCRRLVTRGKGSLVAAQAVFAHALMQFALIAARRECDLLHIHLSVRGSSCRKALLARLARAFGVPYVVHLHGTEYRAFYAGTHPLLRAEIDRMLLGSQRIVVLGEFWAKVMRELQPGCADRIAILPNATEAVAEPVARATGRPVQITFLGQLGQRKGSRDLLAALALLRQNGAWTATLAGDGEIAATRAHVRTLGLESRVSVPGWIGTAQRAALLGASDMLVLPSYAENLPMVVLEAFAHGVATIATPVGAIPEVITPGRNGLLVAPGDVAGLSRAIGRLIENPELRHRLGQAARRDHAAHYDMRRYLVRLAGLWRGTDAVNSRTVEGVRAAS